MFKVFNVIYVLVFICIKEKIVLWNNMLIGIIEGIRVW